MQRIHVKLASILVALGVLTCALFARDTTGSGNLPPASNPVDVGLGGLQTSLTTGGYRFVIASAPAGAPGAVPNSFPATASLQNRSPFQIDFTFPNATAADLKFIFRVFDSAGALVWQSEAEAPPATTTLPLEKFQRWKRTTSIPLKPGGKALATGIYTLEASINGDKQIGASAIFEVISDAPPVDPTPSGLGGFVFKTDRAPVEGQPAPPESAAVDALVVVNEIVNPGRPAVRPPLSSSGKTDALGKFTINVPAGHYRVTANYVAPAGNGTAPLLVYPPKTIEVEVVDRQFSDATTHLVPRTP